MSNRQTCWVCGADLQLVQEVPTALLLRAIAFYRKAPDGQYDHDVVVPIIEAELARRSEAEGEEFVE